MAALGNGNQWITLHCHLIQVRLVMLLTSVFFAAFRLEETSKHSSMDTVFPNIQEAKVSVGPVSRSSRKFQGRAGSGHDIEEIVRQRREVF